MNIVRVGSEEIESNYRNNVAAAPWLASSDGARVLGAIAGCRTLTAAPPAPRGSPNVDGAARGAKPPGEAGGRTRRPRSWCRSEVAGEDRSTGRCSDGDDAEPRRPRALRFRRSADAREQWRAHVLHGARRAARPGRPRSPAEALPSVQSRMSIGVPSGARRRKRRATSFETRTHPCETAWPRSSGRFVPWMPTMP